MNRTHVIIFFLITILAAGVTAGESIDGMLMENDNSQTVSETDKRQPNGHAFSSIPLKEQLVDIEHILKWNRPTPIGSVTVHPPAQIPPLRRMTMEMLEKAFQSAPNMNLAHVELEERLGAVELKKALSGLKLFGGAGIGTYREPVTDTVTRDFQRANMRVGARYPLLGNLKQERLDILYAEIDVIQKEHDIEVLKANGLGALRSVYINYWGHQKKIDISQIFLEYEEDVHHIFQQRAKAGYLLESDRQEFMSAFDLVRRNIAKYRASQKRSLNILRRLTDSALTPFSPVVPRIVLTYNDLKKLKKTVLKNSAELKIINHRIESLQRAEGLNLYTDVKADVAVAGTVSTDFPENEPGYGLGVHFNIQLPVYVKKAESARRKIFKAKMEKNRRQLIQKRINLSQAVEEAWERYLVASENIDFAKIRIDAAKEAVREGLLRSAYMEGDTIEKLQQSRYRYYQAAIEFIEAHTQNMLTQAKILEISSGKSLLPSTQNADTQ